MNVRVLDQVCTLFVYAEDAMDSHLVNHYVAGRLVLDVTKSCRLFRSRSSR
jgi:hypothetical protein